MTLLRFPAAALVVTVVVGFQPAWGCSCGVMSTCDFARAKIVFVGKVVSGGVPVGEEPYYSGGSVQFEVLEAFRGIEPGRRFVTVEVDNPRGMCAANPYQNGQTYLVAPYLHSTFGSWRDGGCFSGQNVRNTFTARTISYLRSHKDSPSPRLTLLGTIAAGRYGHPIPGTKITATTPEGTFTATSNEDGHYELALPKPGHYTARATHSDYPPIAFSFDLSNEGDQAGCIQHFDVMPSKSSISGRLRDASGKPGKGQVALLDPDRKDPWNPNGPVVMQNTHARDDGTFVFDNVPLGRYLIAWNPEGPHGGPSAVPYETTYFPNGVTSLAKAEIIAVPTSGARITNRDLVTSQHRPPVGFRKVTVRVLRSNGLRMKGVTVRVWGNPLEPGGASTLATSMPMPSEWPPNSLLAARDMGQAMVYLQDFFGLLTWEANFEVPANRRLRIEVLDAYGRDLGKSYESRHAPGLSAILQEFRVEVR